MEDADTISDYVEAILADCPWRERLEIEWVRHGNEAAERLAQSPPDIFASDLGHNGTSTEELVQRLAARGKQMPVLLFTGAGAEPVGSFILAVSGPGFKSLSYTWLRKPCGADEIRVAVEHVLGEALKWH